MTVAALAAQALDCCLQEQQRRWPAGQLDGLSRRFQRAQARVAAGPWLLATGEDFRDPTTIGPRPGSLARLFYHYLDRVLISSSHSHRVHYRFLEVLHLLRSPAAQFAPDVAARVRLGLARGESGSDARRGAGPVPPPGGRSGPGGHAALTG
jgi:hypothetical protein